MQLQNPIKNFHKKFFSSEQFSLIDCYYNKSVLSRKKPTSGIPSAARPDSRSIDAYDSGLITYLPLPHNMQASAIPQS